MEPKKVPRVYREQVGFAVVKRPKTSGKAVVAEVEAAGHTVNYTRRGVTRALTWVVRVHIVDDVDLAHFYITVLHNPHPYILGVLSPRCHPA